MIESRDKRHVLVESSPEPLASCVNVDRRSMQSISLQRYYLTYRKMFTDRRICLGAAGAPLVALLLSLISPVSAESPSCRPTGATIQQNARSGTVGAKNTLTTVLDRDGDGYSEIIAYSSRKSSDNSEFWSYSTASKVVETKSFAAGTPAPADYDGDGKTDFATVVLKGSTAEWTIEKSSTGEIVKERSGSGASGVIYGCRFLSTGRHALTTIRGRALLARELGTGTDIRIGTLPENFTRVLGCGDLEGDGTDDILFTYRSPKSSLEIVASLGCKNQVLPYRSIKSFRSGGIVQLAKDDFPLLVTLRSLEKGRDIVTLQSTAELFPYPKFFFTKRTIFTSGRYRSSDGAFDSYGLVYEDGSGTLLSRLFNAPIPRPESVTQLPSGLSLVAPQGVVR